MEWNERSPPALRRHHHTRLSPASFRRAALSGLRRTSERLLVFPIKPYRLEVSLGHERMLRRTRHARALRRLALLRRRTRALINHYRPANPTTAPDDPHDLVLLEPHLRDALRKQKDTISYNLAALKYIKRQSDAKLTAEFFEEEMDEEKVRERIAEGKKRKRVSIKA